MGLGRSRRRVSRIGAVIYYSVYISAVFDRVPLDRSPVSGLMSRSRCLSLHFAGVQLSNRVLFVINHVCRHTGPGISNSMALAVTVVPLPLAIRTIETYFPSRTPSPIANSECLRPRAPAPTVTNIIRRKLRNNFRAVGDTLSAECDPTSGVRYGRRMMSVSRFECRSMSVDLIETRQNSAEFQCTDILTPKLRTLSNKLTNCRM